MRLEPLNTRAPLTGAVRPITEGLLREVYLAPAAPDFPLTEALEGRAAPWAESLEAASEQTTAAIDLAFRKVMRAAVLDPTAFHPEALPESRARAHLSALRDLWVDLGAVPAPLDAWTHVLSSDAGDALEALPVCPPVDCPHTDPTEKALAAQLIRHHGETAGAPLQRLAPGALGALQEGLGQTGDGITVDATLSIHGLRDPGEEASFAAALAQQMLDTGTVAAASEIGVLVPDDPVYNGVAAAFTRLGLPVAGAPEAAVRDAAGEVLALVLTLMQGPAPVTALASLYARGDMPWPRPIGWQMARELVDRGWSRTARNLDGPARKLLDALRPASTPDQLAARLLAAAETLPELDLGPRIGAIRAALGERLDWSLLRQIAAPVAPICPDLARYVEGVSLFDAVALPWRPVRRLIVLGMTGRHWPRLPGAEPFFTEGEIALIRTKAGLIIPGRRAHLARGLNLFRRQLGAATEGATLLASARDLCGERLPPSIALSLIAHAMGAETHADLIRDTRKVSPGTLPVSTTFAPVRALPEPPETGQIHLGRDLLRARDRTSTERSPQSPSRLETLIVSPLAWLLDELGVRDRTWGPEALDVMTLGTLIHDVLEALFPEAAAIPDDASLRTGVPAALDLAISRNARWLAAPDWATEHASLMREAEETVLNWASFLRRSGAEVLHNEIWLAGDHGGILINGRADCLLGLPDGRVLVVDHKRSSSGARRTRMHKGWDLQVALYKAMLQRPSMEMQDTPLARRIAAGARPVTAYHTTRDATVLTDPAGMGIPGVEAAGQDISAHAMVHLRAALAEVGGGTVRLNRIGDATRFEKERGQAAYALNDNTLVGAFLMPEQQGEISE